MRNRFVWILIGGLSLAGFILVIALTRSGPGVSGDSIWYLQGAKSLLSGHGYSIQRADGFLPIAMFPPFYFFSFGVVSSCRVGLISLRSHFECYVLC